MNKLKKIRIILFLTITLAARGEEIFVSLNAKRYNHGFFRVLEKEKNYISIKEFSDVIDGKLTKEGNRISLEMSPETTAIFYMDKKTVTYMENMIKLEKDDIYEEEGDVFISLDVLRNFGEVKYDSSDLLLDFEPNFKLRYELETEAKNNRMIFDNRKNSNEIPKEEVIKVDNRMFSLGKVKGTYSNRDLENSDHTFDLDYTNRMLGGQFSTNIDTVEGDMSYWNLTYDDVIKDKEIVIGDTSSNLSYLPNTGFTGIAIKSDSYNVKFGKTTIDGYANTGNVVELYKNGSLYDYQIAKGGEYSFENLDVNSSTEFMVRVYDENSNYVDEKIDLKSSRNIQEKGGTDYNLFIGETEDNEKLRSGEIYYGVTENTTLGVGYLSLEEEYGGDFGQGSIIRRSKNLPLTYRMTAQSNGEETDYEGDILLEVLNHDVEYEFVKAESEIYSFEKKQRMSVGGNKDKLYYDLAHTRTDGETEYELDISYYLKNVSFETGYTYKEDEEGIRSDIYSAKVSTTLWGEARGIAEIDIIDEEGEDLDEEYEIRVQNYSSDSKFEYSAFVRSNGEDEIIGLEISYDLIEGVTGTVNNYDGETQLGIRAEKTLILDKMEVVDDSLEDSWVYGKVYYDENSNGRYDKKEKLADGTIIFKGKEYLVKDGEYFIEGISEDGINEINISRFRMHPTWKASADKLYIEGTPGTGQELDIALTQMGSIAGSTDGKAGLLEVIRNGKIIKSQQTEEDGFFILEDIPYGDCVIRINGNEVNYTKKDMEDEKFLEISG